MSVISTNLNALKSTAALASAGRLNDVSTTRLSTGLRINSAKDDAAGLAITQKMTSYIRGVMGAIRNANDGLSFAQTAEAGVRESTNLVQRMRELAVQSANGTLSTSNRAALHEEFSQLLSEIDNIAKTTTFNGINMLKTAQSTAFHIGSQANETTALGNERTDTKALGLRGFAPEGELMSGRVGDPSGLQHNAILLNGKNWTSTSGAAGLVSTDAASNIASAINTQVGIHNVIASAYNFVKGSVPTSGTFGAGDIVINRNSVGAASDVTELLKNINRDAGGVLAILNSDGTISLTNNTGAQISIGGTSPSKIGFSSAGTYQGFIKLSNLSQEEIKVTPANSANGLPANIGFISDLQKLGLNGSDGSTRLSGTSVTNSSLGPDDQLLINGIAIPVPNGVTASQKANAINFVAAQTGVTAKSTTELKVELVFTYRPKLAEQQIMMYAVYPGSDNDDKYEIIINGYKISINKNETGSSVAQKTESILGTRLETALVGGVSARERSSALAAGLASIINEDQTMASFVKAEGLPDGTLQLTARRSGEEFISDLRVIGKPGVLITQLSAFTGRTLAARATGNVDPWTEGSLSGTAQNVDFQAAGTGLGTVGGFAGRPSYISFGVGASGTSGDRRIIFNSLDLRDQNMITFEAIRGSNSNGGETPDPARNRGNPYPDESVRFFYSLDGGATRTLLHTLPWNDPALVNWTQQAINLPAGHPARTANTMLIIEQYATARVNDHYAIHNLNFAADPPPPTTGTDDQMIFNGALVKQNIIDGTRSFRVNGKEIDITDATDIHQLVSTINANFPAAVVASADTKGSLILSSSSGENITVEDVSQQPNRFIKKIETIDGVTFAPQAQFKFEGAIEGTDVAVITINGTKLSVTAGSTSAGDVASRVASAINADTTLSASFLATNGPNGIVTLNGKPNVKGQMIALNLKFLEANTSPVATIGNGGGVDGVNYDGALPTDGQAVKLLSNGITSYGTLELTSTTGAEIRIDDFAGGATAAKYGLSRQGEQSDLIGGTLNILSQEASNLALEGIDQALERLNLHLGELGAFQNTLEAKMTVLTTSGADLVVARSRILDTDYTTETIQLSKAQILQKASTAMLAQANNDSKVVLSLLK